VGGAALGGPGPMADHGSACRPIRAEPGPDGGDTVSTAWLARIASRIHGVRACEIHRGRTLLAEESQGIASLSTERSFQLICPTPILENVLASAFDARSQDMLHCIERKVSFWCC